MGPCQDLPFRFFPVSLLTQRLRHGHPLALRPGRPTLPFPPTPTPSQPTTALIRAAAASVLGAGGRLGRPILGGPSRSWDPWLVLQLSGFAPVDPVLVGLILVWLLDFLTIKQEARAAAQGYSESDGLASIDPAWHRHGCCC